MIQLIKDLFLATVFVSLFINTVIASNNYSMQISISNQDVDSFSNRDIVSMRRVDIEFANFIAETNVNGVNIEEETEDIMQISEYSFIVTVFLFSMIGSFVGFSIGIVIGANPFSVAFIGTILSAIAISLRLTWRITE